MGDHGKSSKGLTSATTPPTPSLKSAQKTLAGVMERLTESGRASLQEAIDEMGAPAVVQDLETVRQLRIKGRALAKRALQAYQETQPRADKTIVGQNLNIYRIFSRELDNLVGGTIEQGADSAYAKSRYRSLIELLTSGKITVDVGETFWGPQDGRVDYLFTPMTREGAEAFIRDQIADRRTVLNPPAKTELETNTQSRGVRNLKRLVREVTKEQAQQNAIDRWQYVFHKYIDKERVNDYPED